MSKQPPIPGMNPGETLDQFHDRAIIPSRDEISSKLAAIDEFIRAVEGAFSKSGQSIAEIHKSGSLGKGTAIRGGADIDLVVYFNGLSTMNDLKSKRPQLLKDLEQKISEIRLWTGRVRLQGKTPYALAYTFDGEQMDILPGFDIVKAYPGGLKTIYSELSALSSPACSASEAQNYSVSLAPLQIKFVKGHNETVKRGIRLLKYWKQAKNLDLRSYAMELLAIHAARSGHEKSTKDVFQYALTTLADPKMKVAFNDHYDSGKYCSSKRPPYVMDPANPYMDTFSKKDMDVAAIRAAAQETLTLL